MRCRETTMAMNAYLDGEVGALERRAIQEHVGGCSTCAEELAALSRTRTYLMAGLQRLAAEAAPSETAWTRLQAGIACDSVGSAQAVTTQILTHGRGRATRRWRRVMPATVAIVVLAVCIVAAVPSARSAAGNLLANLFNWHRFAPTEAVYLPEGFDRTPLYQVGMVGIPSGTGAEGDAEGAQKLQTEQSLYRTGDRFVLIKNSSDTDAPLPDGQPAEVNGDDAVLITGLSGTAPPPEQLVVDIGPSVSDDPRYTVHYRDAIALTWVHKGNRIEVLSNLPVDEVFKIAEGLVVGHVEKASP